MRSRALCVAILGCVSCVSWEPTNIYTIAPSDRIRVETQDKSFVVLKNVRFCEARGDAFFVSGTIRSDVVVANAVHVDGCECSRPPCATFDAAHAKMSTRRMDWVLAGIGITLGVVAVVFTVIGVALFAEGLQSL